MEGQIPTVKAEILPILTLGPSSVVVTEQASSLAGGSERVSNEKRSCVHYLLL